MPNLTIAQALRRANKVRGSIRELKGRASQAVSHEADKKPTFEFSAVRGELASAKEELIKLESAIAVANAATTITHQGKPMRLAEAVKRLREFKDASSWLTSLEIREGVERSQEFVWDEGSERRTRVAIEVTFVTHLSEVARVKELESLSDQFEALNDLVEQANHRTEVELPT